MKRSLYFLLSVVLLLSCQSKKEQNKKEVTKATTSFWKSSFRDVSITYSDEWSMSNTPIDSPDKTMVGVIQASHNLTFILKIVKDVSKSDVSDARLYQYSQKAMLRSDKRNLILEEKSDTLHNLPFHTISFLMHTKEDQRLIHKNYFHRTGNDMITLQCVYPATSTPKDQFFPASISEVINSLELNGYSSKDSK